MKRQFLSILALATIANISGAEIIRNGSFQHGLQAWWTMPRQVTAPGIIAIDRQVAVDHDSSSLKISRPDHKCERSPRIGQDIRLEPNTNYQLTAYIYGKNIISVGQKYGAYIGVTDNKTSYYFGRNGLWKWDRGSFNWSKLTARFNTAKLDLKKTILVAGFYGDVTGTIWFDNISLKKISVTKTAATPVATMGLFPFNFLKHRPFTICVNRPGVLTICTSGGSKYNGQKGVLILDLPEYLSCEGVSSFVPNQLTGAPDYKPAKFKIQPLTRNGEKYFRYHITIDHYYNSFVNSYLYRNNLLIKARPESVGRQGKVYWSWQLGSQRQSEHDGNIAVVPAVTGNFTPCKNFKLVLGALVFPETYFPSYAQDSLKFWSQLATAPILINRLNQPPVTGFDNRIMGVDKALRITHYNLKNALKFQNKALPDINAQGKRTWHAASWYLLDDSNQEYEKNLREMVRCWKNDTSIINQLIWDFEPGPYGLDLQGRQRFAKQLKLDHVPSLREINNQYHQQWFNYMVDLHAKYIEKVVKIVKSEHPNAQFWLCSDPLHAGKNPVALWCGVDIRKSDAILDGHMPMAYYTGTRYFDDLQVNLATLTKPMIFLNDPHERAESFFNQYTPEKIEQNIIATAALGGQGFGFWPDDALPGNFYPKVLAAYQTISRYEQFYQKGRRCDKEFKITPLNAISKKLTTPNGKEIPIYFPNFAPTLRYTIHQLGEDYLFTLFNYNAKLPMLLNISQGEKSYIMELPPQSVKVLQASQPGDQKILKQRARHLKKQLRPLQEIKKGNCTIEWCAGTQGEPYLALKRGHQLAWIDLMNSGRVAGLFNSSGRTFLGEGFLGQLLMYDRLQPQVDYEIEHMKIIDDSPSLTLKGVVGPYAGANPQPNPLQNLIIRHNYTLTAAGLQLSIAFTNPTAKPMTWGFRWKNHPRLGALSGKNGTFQTWLQNSTSPLQNRRQKQLLFTHKAAELPFMNTLKPEKWLGGAIKLQKGENDQADCLIFQPGSNFSGVYFWFNPQDCSVEFLTGQITLPPGATQEFTCHIKTN